MLKETGYIGDESAHSCVRHVYAQADAPLIEYHDSSDGNNGNDGNDSNSIEGSKSERRCVPAFYICTAVRCPTAALPPASFTCTYRKLQPYNTYSRPMVSGFGCEGAMAALN